MKKLFLLLVLLLLSAPMFSFAQEPTVPFDQGFDNPAFAKKKEVIPKNAEEFAKLHYEKCLERDHLALTEKSIESICSCSAANLSESLSFDEMQLMSKDTKEGKSARSKFIGFSYAPCVKYLVADLTRTDCLAGELVKKIRVGKMAVCKCAEKKMLANIDKFAADYMIQAVVEDPMTLDPIDKYLSSQNFISQRDDYTEKCIYQLAYERDNRK